MSADTPTIPCDDCDGEPLGRDEFGIIICDSCNGTGLVAEEPPVWEDEL